MEQQIEKIKNWLGSGSINLFGEPFAGKDTQGEKLAELLDGVLVAGGDILRHYHDQEKIKELMSTGDLFPTDFYFELVLPYLSKPEFSGKPLILSSVGRMKGEEETILKATAESGHPTKAVVMLTLDEAEVWHRFDTSQQMHDREGRVDDNRDVLANRLLKFKQQTIPVVNFYRDQGLLIEVDGSLTKEQVTQEIIDGLLVKSSN